MNLIEPSRFNKNLNDQDILLVTLLNSRGTTLQLTNYGARLVSFYTPDRNGKLGDIVLGYDCIEDYLRTDNSYFGATIGRYGNRIANAQFKISGTLHLLDTNDGKNNLHGGSKGLHTVVWDVEKLSDQKARFKYISRDGDQGFPGKLTIYVTYSLNERDDLIIEYKATTNKTTVINLTHHSYFNLYDGGGSSIDGHLLQLFSSNYTPVNELLLPTGKVVTVKDTPFDFTTQKSIGDQIDSVHNQLDFGSGYDHNYVLDGRGMRLVATAEEPKLGRVLHVITDQPGLQFYSGNSIASAIKGKYGSTYNNRHGFCLETQHFPDSPNQPHFPSTLLEPSKVYTSTTIYAARTDINSLY